jgi:AraC family ethanolamine operon transcriptional activator
MTHLPPPEPTCSRRILHRTRSSRNEFAQANASIADICAAAGVTRRTLHLGFLEVFGIPPIAYLRALRLNGARADLRNPDARDFTITQVATNWGFLHLGRFSVSYRGHFGESPSATVRRVWRWAVERDSLKFVEVTEPGIPHRLGERCQ